MADSEVEITEDAVIEFEHEDHFDSIGIGGINAAIEAAGAATTAAGNAATNANSKAALATAAAADASAAADLARSAVSQGIRFWFAVKDGHLVIADAGEQPVEEEEE